MFILLVLRPDALSDLITTAVHNHWRQLDKTGYVGSLSQRNFPGGALYWDAESPHAALFEDVDQERRTSVLVRGGYLAGPDFWRKSLHSTEFESAWGEFAAIKATWGSDNETTVKAWADPAASWPIYFGQTGLVTVVSNDALMAGIALGRTRLDRQTCYELLAYGHSLTALTTIDGVRRLMPGEQFTAVSAASDMAQFAVMGAPAYRYGVPDSPVSTHLPAAHAALRESISAVGPLDHFLNATMQLSGGLDSRLTAAVLAEIFDARPVAITLDLSDDAEVAVASDVAGILGYPHRVVRLGEMDSATARAGWILTAGQVSVHAAAGNILGYQAAPTNSDSSTIIVGGWPGDCLIGSYVPLLPTMLAAPLTPWVIADWARKRGPMWHERGIAIGGRHARHAVRTALRNLQRALRLGSGRSAAQKISYWAMFARQPSFSYVSPARLTASVLEVTPLLARPYIEQLMLLDGSEIIGKSFYRALLIEAFPQLSGVVYSATGEPITDVPTSPRWLPRSTDDVYHLLPAALQTLIRRFVAFRRRNDHPDADPIDTSAEVRFWRNFFDAEQVSGRVDLGGIVVDASATDDIHVRSVALALKWTEEYLTQAAHEMDSNA